MGASSNIRVPKGIGGMQKLTPPFAHARTHTYTHARAHTHAHAG